ncbi:hypothetical protein GH714_009615 [Hevea brasiliensis]|uniref:hAT-like transposase RNase-H fold domain-containing protein n=1 Tax=Hevea brasiliensis TaxID=3981 RepID=A0A6A6MYS1_HEVBR|nr:hypothetical protein GH714_009565 [Hevea brasiliensis]KAF2316979.1 hypothetical protein GH714_009615 [Hevea brasiliensis]
MDDAITNIDEANHNKENDVIEANEKEENPFASKKQKQTYKNFKYDHAKIREVLAHMILVHELPFLFTEYEVFNLLMRTVTPYYKKISHEIVRKDCFSAYDIEKKKVKDLLEHVHKDNLAYKNSLALNAKLFHVRCCADILNLLVQDGLSKIEDIIFKVHKSVKHLAKAESRHLNFSEIGKQLKFPSKKLILDFGTRWNAIYFMLSIALEFKDVFPRYQQRDPTYTFLPNEED